MAFTEVAKTGTIPPGTLKHVEAFGKEICIANVGGTFYAFSDRCPHMNAPLSQGLLRGGVLTCPMHFSRFDVRTGKRVSGPVQPQIEGIDRVPPPVTAYMRRITELMEPIRTGDLEVIPVRIEGEAVLASL